MRYFLFIVFLSVVLAAAVAGKRGSLARKPPIEVFPDMDRQPRLRPQEPSKFFSDQLASRQPLEGTVARGTPYEDIPLHTGRVTGSTNFVEVMPVEVTGSLLTRGQERFQIYCLPCHGAVGDGKGVITKYGMAVIANLHDPRIVKMPDGEIFNTVTYGKNLMGAYGATVSIADRWAIISYVRALQRSRLATMDDVPEAARPALK